MFGGNGPKEGWAAIILLFGMLLCVAWSIQTADWTEGLSILQGVILLGGISGVILAKSRTPNRMAHLLSVIAGITWSAYLTSQVLARNSHLSLPMAVAELERQLTDWVYVLFSGGTSAGNYIFLMLLAFLLWVLGYFSAWAVFRWQRVWWAVIAGGLSMLANVTYAPRNLTGYLIVFLLCSLLLVVRTNLAAQEREWDVSRVLYEADLAYGFLRAGLVISLVAILLAWIAPSALASRPIQEAWSRLGEPWRRLQDQSSRIFHNLNYQNQPAFVSFGLSTRFGGAVNLTDEPVMDVRANDGRYWRVIVFHEYTGAGWDNTDTETIALEQNEQDLAFPQYHLRREVTQTITLRQDLNRQGTIAAAGQPLRGSLPLEARVSLVSFDDDPRRSAGSEGSFPEAPGDASVLYSREPLREGDVYQVVSSLAVPDQQSLRNAGTGYPAWVVPRYLQLPTTLPDRVRVLAQQITEGWETPYDKAVAIETYLRNIPYNEQIEGPAPGQDGVDYFLFEAKEGYCDYYASAMVTLLRSVGVPARYVQGYSRGEYDNGVYRVLERDGHAWPEVYFPGIGWVEFEPTAAEPLISRPATSGGQVAASERSAMLRRDFPEMDDRFLPPDNNQAAGGGLNEDLIQGVGRWIGFGLAFVALPMLAVTVFVIRRRRRMNGLSAAERAYEDLVTFVRTLFRVSPMAHQTPYEYAGAVNKALHEEHPAVEQLTGYYVEERFGGRVVPPEAVEVAWKDAWPILCRRWFDQKTDAIWRFAEKLGLSSRT